MSPGMFAGQVLLWGGFLGAALASVLRLEVADNRWATIPWPWYLASLAVGIAGAVLIRGSRRNAIAGQSSVQERLANARQSLAEAARQARALADRIGQSTCEEVLEWIDQQCGPPLNAFADDRQSVQAVHGTAVYTAVMSEFASGERYLNRAWSAAADGYADEVTQCVGHAAAFLEAAVRELPSKD